MRDLLEQIYGNKLEYCQEAKLSLPLYLLDNRKFYNVSILDYSFIIVYFVSNGRFSIKTLKKQLMTYRTSVKCNVVYGFNKITTFQRKSMIENDIPFITNNGQMYIPFLGIYFDKCVQDEDIVYEQFMPASQLLFLLFLYGDNSYTKSGAANKLKINPMSVTRASKQLVNNGLIKEEKRGTEIWMTINDMGKTDFYEKGEPCLINPIQSVIYIPNGRVDIETPESGEFSLSKRTDLGYPEFVEYAFYKDAPGIKDKIEINPDLYEKADIIRIQKWKYDPRLFSLNGMVDPASLISSLKNINDDRLHKCLEKVKEEIWTWQIT
ncbi:MAG: hypothetical protein J6M65_05535 [Eubacterium sp.]|nr:hypothetical protein [Eubacterium sp.]